MDFKDIPRLYEDIRRGFDVSIDRSDIELIMKADDLFSRAMLYDYIDESGFMQSVTPTISDDKVEEFSFLFLRDCILRDERSEDVPTRYEAGYELVRHFVDEQWNRPSTSYWRSSTKELCETLYLGESKQLRDFVINAVLEHIFEIHSARDFFGEWKSDVRLSEAYRDALMWSEGGGRMPDEFWPSKNGKTT